MIKCNKIVRKRTCFDLLSDRSEAYCMHDCEKLSFRGDQNFLVVPLSLSDKKMKKTVFYKPLTNPWLQNN